MINLQQLVDRYKDVGLQEIRFRYRHFYEINSDIPLNLSSHGGSAGFILNDKDCVQIFDIIETDEDYLFFKDGEQIHRDVFWALVDAGHRDDIHLERNNIEYYDGKTLENYYPHPYFPEKQIIAFEIINNLPFCRIGRIEKVVGFDGDGLSEWIEIASLDGAYDFTVEDCLNQPEFFKPLYE